MGLASYAIVGSAGEWRIRHDGKDENVYQTKESAFEAVVAAASLASDKVTRFRSVHPAAIQPQGPLTRLVCTEASAATELFWQCRRLIEGATAR
jgi:hypothetical protein